MIQIIEDDIEFDGIDSSRRKTATRLLVYSREAGDSTMDLAESNLLPRIGDVHPKYTRFTVDSVEKPIVSEGKPTFCVKVKYKHGGDSGGGSGGGENGDDGGEVDDTGKVEVKPWNLGPQNVQLTSFEYESPAEYLYDHNNKKHDLKNTAGQRILLSAPFCGTKISFTKNYKHMGNTWRFVNHVYQLNDKSLTVCNVKIARYHGKLYPIYPQLHTVYENDGQTIKWEYESINFNIDVKYDHDWRTSVLNVGKLAKFNGVLEPIFVYTPWMSEDPYVNAKTLPKYGSIADVQKAQAEYERIVKGGKIPWSQFDEELPLDESGGIDMQAIQDQVYRNLTGFLYEVNDWSEYSLPGSI